MAAHSTLRGRERAAALVAVVAVQLALGVALLTGLRVDIGRSADAVQRLVDVTLPVPPRPKVHRNEPKRARSSAAPARQTRLAGGSPAAPSTSAPPAVATIVPLRPAAPPAGGGSGTGTAPGAGSGGGASGNGEGSGGGGTDLEKIGGDILESDYPRALGNAGIGGRVSVTFTVETNGRVSGCHVTRSSGVPQLDALTCRLMEERFRFRPSTDASGRPIADEVDWDQDWIAPRH